MSTDVGAWSIASGVLWVAISLILGVQKQQYPSLRTVVVIFLAGAAIPAGVVLISNAVIGKPRIEPTEYKVYTSVGAIVILWLAIREIFAEFPSIGSNRE